MAKLSNYQLWEMGTRLADAWLEFASEADKTRYAQSKKIPASTVRPDASIIVNIANFLGDMSKIVVNNNHNNEIVADIKESLLERIYNNQLTALGYRIEPSVYRSPVRIDSEKFYNNDPDWDNETLDARGYRYAEIRIVDPSKIPDAVKPRRGRIGSGTIIRRTIAEMISEGFDICNVDRQIAVNEIIRRISNKNPKGSGLSPQNLRKYILEICPKRNIE